MTFEEILNKAPKEIQELILELKTLRERPDYHPEPNAYCHVKIVVTRLIDTGDINLILSALLHDSGKLVMNKPNIKTGFPSAPGHDKFGAQLALKYSNWIIEMGGDPNIVSWICEQHMRIKQLPNMKKNKQEELLLHKYFDKLVIFTKADSMLSEWIWN